MTPEQFCYWMQGFTELCGGEMPTEDQWKSINEHLQTVFKKVTPEVQRTYPAFPGTIPGLLQPQFPPGTVTC